jgi:hypothetical protein
MKRGNNLKEVNGSWTLLCQNCGTELGSIVRKKVKTTVHAEVISSTDNKSDFNKTMLIQCKKCKENKSYKIPYKVFR